MPIAFQKIDLSPTCAFSEWELIDENHLVRTLAWLYLRKPKHAVQIINCSPSAFMRQIEVIG